MRLVTNNCKDGKCVKCGNCCTEFLPLTRSEVDRIRLYVKEHNIKQSNKANGRNVYLFCPFKDFENNCCTVYPVRPSICRCFMCNQDERTVKKNSLDHALVAYFNAQSNNALSNIATLHELIYDDYDTGLKIRMGFARMLIETGQVLTDDPDKIFKELVDKSYRRSKLKIAIKELSKNGNEKY